MAEQRPEDSAAAKAFEVLDRTVEYGGFFRLERLGLRFSLFEGGWSAPIEREVYAQSHAAAVVLYDPVADRVVLIEQFRAAAINAPGGPWQIEIVAGLIDPGETPEDVVRREAVEEAGCSVEGVELIGEFLLSPGGSSDRMFLYCARIDSSEAGGIHGLIEEGENIRVFTMATDDAMAAISDGRIGNATCVIGLQWLALNRTRLRAAWQPSETASP